MQVASALNNTIRILFNPKIESFKLFDFLIVKSSDERYLAQIIEIYEDKFDSSQNVAKLKLFYKITQNNEVMPYDNFTPSKECEIIKVKSNEVENFINNDKKTFIFATDVKTSQALNIQFDFFNKNAVILSDKIEHSNAISLNLAKKLSEEKNIVLIDYTGIVEFDEAKKIKACKNFKMPLNFNTLDCVFERCLADASLEFQAIGTEILNAIKKYAKKQELGFIPFNAFVNVILEQYKVTPYSELQLLLSRMKKYQMFDIFAKNKKDYGTLHNTVEKNKITIIDLSGLDNFWQKAYLEYIVEELEDEIYLISRINDEGFDTELINKIYNEKQNITFVPNVSYNYSKLPSILQYCKNYILMPSLYQRNDFLDANFALSNLISDECILFGESTDNFLYLARDYELEIQEKRKNYRKIALTMAGVEQPEEVEEQQKISDSQILIKELSDLEERNLKEHQEESSEEIQEEDVHDEFQEINQNIKNQLPQELETIKNIQEVKITNEPTLESSSELFINEPVEDGFSQLENVEEKENTQETFESVLNEEIIEENAKENNIIQEESNIETEENKKPEVEAFKGQVILNDEENSEVIKNAPEETVVQDADASLENTTDNTDSKESKVDYSQELDISDEELDFFELAKNSSNLEKEENVVIDNVEYKVSSDNSENNIIDAIETDKGDDVDLSEIASNAIENNFEDIINSKTNVQKPEIEIDENTTIQVDINKTNESNLPIFQDDKEELNQKNNQNEFRTGASVIHSKYGKGTIVKIIQYDQRQLLQIDFVNSGKKLLDPKIAEIQLEQ